MPCASNANWPPFYTGLLLREMKAKLFKGSNRQKSGWWAAGLCANLNTVAFHLSLHLLVIQGLQEASSTLSLIEQGRFCKTELSA